MYLCLGSYQTFSNGIHYTQKEIGYGSCYLQMQTTHLTLQCQSAKELLTNVTVLPRNVY